MAFDFVLPVYELIIQRARKTAKCSLSLATKKRMLLRKSTKSWYWETTELIEMLAIPSKINPKETCKVQF